MKQEQLSHQISRRGVLRGLGAAGALAALGPLAACGDDSGGAGSATSGTLTFVYNGDADLQKSYTTLFKEFSTQNPNITLKAQGIPAKSWAEFANTVSTRLAGGQPLDIVQIATEGQRIFASKGLLEPLDPYIEKDKALVDDYYADIPSQLKDMTARYSSPDGKTYYMPGSYNTVAMYINTQVFEKAGVEIPTGEWTWDDFRTAALAIKQKTGAFMLPAEPNQFEGVTPWLLTNGTAAIDAEWKTATFNSPAAIEAATFVRSLVADGLAPKPGGTYVAANLMAQGKLACLAGGRWPANDLRLAKFIEPVQIVPFPKKVQAGSPVGWDAWPILKQSKNKDAAWTLIKFLISKGFGESSAAGGSAAVPARASVAASAAFTDNAPKGSELLVKILDGATSVPGPDRGAETQVAIQEGWLAAVSGTKDPTTALNEANAKLETLLK